MIPMMITQAITNGKRFRMAALIGSLYAVPDGSVRFFNGGSISTG
jgi:hypothetical protein